MNSLILLVEMNILYGRYVGLKKEIYKGSPSVPSPCSLDQSALDS